MLFTKEVSMMEKNFIHSIINVSTEYSMRDSVILVPELIEKAKAMEAPAVIVTERNTLRSAPEVLTHCMEAGLRGSVGLRIDLQAREGLGEIALIPKDFEGFIAVGKLLSDAPVHTGTGEPFVTLTDLQTQFCIGTNLHGHVMLSTCGMKGLLAQTVSEGQESSAKNILQKLTDIFGKENVFVEVQYHGETQEQSVLPCLVKLADELHLPLLAGNDPYFVDKSDDNKTVWQLMHLVHHGECPEFSASIAQRRLKTPDELKAALNAVLTGDQTERAISGIGLFASMCDVQPPSQPHYPKYHTEENASAEALLKQKVYARIAVCAAEWNEVYERRLREELNVIGDLGFCDYLLIVADIVAFARSEAHRTYHVNCLPVGPGRGSAVGSLVCYLLGITDIDPVEHDLMFERFLNRNRTSMPDIDLDLAAFIRDRVVDHLMETYGSRAVCRITSPVRLKAKESLTYAARYLESPATGEELARVCKSGSCLADNDEELKSFNENPKACQVIRLAGLMEGRIRTLSKHPCGFVIGDSNEISDYLPVIRDDDGSLTAECDKSFIETFYGLLKFDLLSLRTLDLISNVLSRIEKKENVFIDFSNIPIESDVFLKIFDPGHTEFIFQFGSTEMKKWLRTVRPCNISQLTLLVAAVRPGPAQFLPVIHSVLHSGQLPDFPSPALKRILKETCGCIIYQEQLLRIFTDVAGFSPQDADRIRVAVCKKKQDVIDSVHEQFVAGCVGNGMSQEEVEHLFEQIVAFGSYAFNKSHAAAYAVLAYRTGWLLARYPSYFLAAALQYSNRDDVTGTFYRECCRYETEILPPDINLSGVNADADKNSVRLGFASIRGCESVGRQIVNDRHKHRAGYTDFLDFLCRICPGETALKHLALCGVFDSLGVVRGAVADHSGEIVKLTGSLVRYAQQSDSETDPAELTILRKQMTDCQNEILNLAKGPNGMTLSMIVKAEQKLMGIPVSFGKLEDFDTSGNARRTTTIHGIHEGHHRICGMVWECEDRKRKKDKEPFLSILFGDGTGLMKCVLPTHRYAQYQSLISEGEGLCLEGDFQIKNNQQVFWINAVSPLERTNLSYYLPFQNYFEFLTARKEIARYTNYPLANLYIRIGDGEWTLFPEKVSPEIVKSFPMIEPGGSFGRSRLSFRQC